MKLYDLARSLKRSYKAYQKRRAGRYLSKVRRIEHVAPPSGGRYVAMTFDDGPTVMQTNPRRSALGLTDDLMKTLAQYDAKGTFDVIGTTAENYPDEAGEVGSFTWGGKVYDHYPDFNQDLLAGAVNQPELIQRLLDQGHEITSHTYRHILFGRNRLIYGQRKYYDTIHQVIDDLKLLDELMQKQFHTNIRMSRPPHYIDSTCDGYSAYDAYRYMDYQYMAASFDGGGWQVSGSYQKDVELMIQPVEAILRNAPEALNGQIIFQKDGCNMSKETPVADALGRQLERLTENGYKVITVSQLLSLSPFEDLPDTDPIFTDAKALLERGYCIAHRNNTLQADKPVSVGELLTMAADPAKLLAAYRAYVDSGFQENDSYRQISARWHIKPLHPYFHAFLLAHQEGAEFPGELKSSNTLLTQRNASRIWRQLHPDRSELFSSPTEQIVRKRDLLPNLNKCLP